MTQIIVSAANTPYDLGAYVQQVGNFDQVTSDTINVICDAHAVPLTIILPRCPTSPANLKLIVVDAAGNAGVNNITLQPAYATVQCTGGIAAGTLTVSAMQSGAIYVGMPVWTVGGGLQGTVTAFGSGTGGVGNYTISGGAAGGGTTLYDGSQYAPDAINVGDASYVMNSKNQCEFLQIGMSNLADFGLQQTFGSWVSWKNG